MVGKIGLTRQARRVTLVATAVLLLTCGAALAQLNGMNGGSPLLGVPGNTAPAVGGTGIPFGSTELGVGGLSPMPLGATTGLAPFGLGIPGSTSIGGGLGITGSTMPGIAGSTSSLGSGLSPGVMPPTALSPALPTQTPGVSNFGVGGIQRSPGSTPGIGTLR
jgi:hypothetical protein